MKIFTRQELEQLGMSEEQINAILLQSQNTVFEGLDNKSEVKNDSSVEAEDVKPKVYTESDISNILDIQKYASGEIVELPGFVEGHPFIAKLKRPSMLKMVKTGKIPSTLINQATQLFQKGASSLGKENTVSDMYDIMESICEAALVKPSYSEIKSSGLSLTDEQMMAIFSYTQQGVKALEQFRKK